MSKNVTISNNRISTNEVESSPFTISAGGGFVEKESTWNIKNDARGISADGRDMLVSMIDVTGSMPSGSEIVITPFVMMTTGTDYIQLPDQTTVLGAKVDGILEARISDVDYLTDADFIKITYRFQQGGADYDIDKLLSQLKKKDDVGGGDIAGPAGAVDGNIVAFDGVTGKLLKDAGAAVGDLIPLSQKGAANGVATLDAGSKLTASQLPTSAMEYKGAYNIVTNTPTLTDGAGTNGDMYLCSVSGSRDFGSGLITVAAGDAMLYNGSIWQAIVGVATNPGGNDTNIQYNNGGVFGGSDDFTWKSSSFHSDTVSPSGAEFTEISHEITSSDKGAAIALSTSGDVQLQTRQPAGSYVTHLQIFNSGLTAIGSDGLDVLGDVIFNQGHLDKDLTIQKDAIGETAYKYDAGDDTHTFSADTTVSNAGLHLNYTSAGDAAITQAAAKGVLLTSGAMSSGQYTPGVKFGSTDSSFTTTNPKFLAGIFGVASETFGADTDSGMGIHFFTTPDNAGVTPDPVLAASINQNGVLFSQKGFYSDGTVIFNVGYEDEDFSIRNRDDKSAYNYNAGTDRHYFRGDVHILRTNESDAYFWDESQNRHQFFQDFRLYKGDGTTIAYYHDTGSDLQYWTSNAVFNNLALDADFTINKQTAGVAYSYNAGTDAHTFSGTISFDSGDVTFNGLNLENDFVIGKKTSGNAYIYDANLDIHRFSGLFDIVGQAVFNHDNNDVDFYIEKNTAGTAYKYDAGDDTHTFSGDVYAPVLKGLTSMAPVPDANFLWTSDAEGGQVTSFEITNNDDDVKVRMELQAGGYFRIRTQEPASSYVTRFTVGNNGNISTGTGDFSVGGNFVSNPNHQDLDFTIGKDIGVQNAYVYDAGDDTHTFSGDATFENDLDFGTLKGVDLYNMGTGTLSGCSLTINGGDPTKLDVTAGVVMVADYSTITAPVLKKITVAAQQVSPQLSTSWNKWISVKESVVLGIGEIVFDPNFTQVEKRTHAVIGRTWNDGTDDIIDGVGQYTTPGFGQAKAMEDMAYCIGSINKYGNAYSANGANLKLDKTAGYSFRFSAFWATNPVSPHTPEIEDSSQTSIGAYYYVSQNATSADILTDVDPDNWDNAGTVEAVPTGYYTLQRLYYYPSSQVLSVTYGQELFTSLAAATEKAGKDSVEIQEALLEGAILRGWLAVREGTTALNSTVDAAMTTARSLGEPPATTSTSYVNRSFSLSDYGSSNVFYLAGFYEAPSSGTTLTIGGTVTQVYGSANKALGAHAFCVASGAGGSGLVLTVSGTSITDAGVRTTSDSEIIVANTGDAITDQYYETEKKWLGTVTYTLTGSTGSFAFNYGFCKYEDFGNRAFAAADVEVTGKAAANASDLNIELIHHSNQNWVYSAGAFIAGPTGANVLCDMATDYGSDRDIYDEENFSYKRTNLGTPIAGNIDQGVIIRMTQTTNNAIRYATAHIGVMA